VYANAGSGALGIGRSHFHMGMIAVGAHAVRNDAGEGLLASCESQGGDGEQTKNQALHAV
jgi:hypothetical protein